jgi:putative nucleotidyltransferase with HDIG domain
MATVVPTGGMVIEKHGTFKAFLGSCVGLALYDTKTGLGGMLHILLPDPICEIPDYHRTYYATTGIPLFIEAMKEQGAKPETMSAYIAGGALIDALSPQDREINIGHRTLDITLAHMKENGIAVKMMEAGGVNPFCFTFLIDSCKAKIEPVLLEKPAPAPKKSLVKKEDILDIIEKLIPVPQITFNIANMLTDDGVDIGSIAEEIKKDQVLSAKILRLCNSAYIAPSRKIASIDNAILYLGSKLLLQMVITAQVEGIYHSSEKGYSLCRGGMYHHALATARLSKALANVRGKLDPDIAYTAGLLHDIGKVALDQYIAGVQPLFYRMIMEERKDSKQLEQKIIGFDHCHVGLMLCENWSLPEVLKDVILFHHTPLTAENSREMVNLVYVADLFTGKFLSGLELESLDTTSIQASLDIAGLTPQDIYDNLSIIADFS